MSDVFMKRAVELARKGVGLTSPNPTVGAVIVKGGQIVAEDWHRKAGTEHAEILVIRQMMAKSGIVTRELEPTLFHNATLYVTLEPCAHVGKTQACMKALAKASFKKVCVGMRDPYKEVNGRGIRYLKSQGIDVDVINSKSNVAREVRALNQAFIKWAQTGLPYVVLKTGMSLDGKIATYAGDSQWITSEGARHDGRVERSACDAVLVGAGTVRADNPELGSHGKFRHKELLRVILDRKLSLSPKLNVFRDENVLVACTDLASKTAKAKFKSAGIEFKSFGKEEVSIKRLLKFLSKRNIQSVFVEGGSYVNGAFYDAARKDPLLLDRCVFYIAPRLIGGKDALSVFGGEGVDRVQKAFELQDLDVQNIAGNLKVAGNLNFY